MEKADLKKWKYVNLSEVCQYENAKPKKIYKAGTIWMPLGAAESRMIGRLEYDGCIKENHVAAIIPRDCDNAEYIYYTLEDMMAEIKAKYLQTINMQFSVLDQIRIKWHMEREAREVVCKCIRTAEKIVAEEERHIEHLKSVKEYYLSRLMI